MAQGKQAIRSRIRSVDSTKKITRAMQLVAASKLKRQKECMEGNRLYAKRLSESTAQIVASLKEQTHPYLQACEGRLLIVITSDMGLCGAYNANIERELQQISPQDAIVMIGAHGMAWVSKRKLRVVETLSALPQDCYGELSALANRLLEKVREGAFGTIEVLYTKYINSLTFEPRRMTLLPFSKEEALAPKGEMILEPQGAQLLDTLIPLYVRSQLYSCYLEAKTSEYASRRTAMENATNNAQEIRDALELAYNQARQAAITQEITEIVGGVNALT